MLKYEYFSKVGESKKIHSNLPSNSRASTLIGESIADKSYFPKGNIARKVSKIKKFNLAKMQYI